MWFSKMHKFLCESTLTDVMYSCECALFIHMNKYDCVPLSCFCALFHVSSAFAQCFLGIFMYTETSYGSRPNASTHVGCKSARLGS